MYKCFADFFFFSWEQFNLNSAPPFLCRLEFSWSSVELSRPQYSVCEGQGPVSLDIIRKGNLAESAYITVKVCSSFLLKLMWSYSRSDYYFIIPKLLSFNNI